MSVEPRRTTAPEGASRKRCATCKRFARLLPGQTECDACAGVLPLDFGKRGGRNA